MRIGTLMLLGILCSTIGCKREDEAPIVTHSQPAHGVRIVEIVAGQQDRPIELFWQYGEMEAPERWCTISPGTLARIVLVEDVEGKYPVYLNYAGATTKLLLDIPERQPDAPRTVSIIEQSPSGTDLAAGPQEVIRVEWIDSRDTHETDKTTPFIAFEIKYQAE